MTGPAQPTAPARPGLFRPGAFGFPGSLDLAFILITLLTLACLIGALIPQNQAPQWYLEKFGPRWQAYFSVLGFTDLFHSLWFRGLLLVFGFNLLFCTLERLPLALKKTARLRPAEINPGCLGPAQWQAEFTPPPGQNQAAWLRRARGLAEQAAGPLKMESAPWGRLYWAERGRFGPLGPYVIHLSLLLFLTAALVGQIWGYSGFITIAEGEEARIVEGRRPARTIELPFAIALDKFHLDLHPADPSAVDEYRSLVTITEAGRPAQSEEIKVNHPLTQQGITFYQSSYTRAGGVVHLDAQGPGGLKAHLDMKPGRAESLPGGGQVKIMDFKPALMNVGPAALVEIRAENQPVLEEWIFQTRPEFVAPQAGPWIFSLAGFEPGYLSTFQVVKDPGLPLVWLACLMMAAGFALTYLGPRRRLVVLEISASGGRRPRLIAAAYRSKNSRLAAEKGRRLAEAINNLTEA